MNNKGQIGFGFIVMAAVAILIGLAFFPSISPNIGAMTKTFTSTNVTMAMPANGATSELTMCGQRAAGTVQIINASTGTVVPTTNYTITQSTGTDGYLTAKITTTNSLLYAGRNVNVTCYDYEPKGYVAESGSRALVGLIAIAFALLIIVAAIPNLKDKLFDFIRT